MPIRLLIVLICVSGMLWAINSSNLIDVAKNQQPKLIAHRGVHQIYNGASRNADTCRAAKILPPTHSFIENTLPSIKAAFDYGADVVELDVHLTPDGVFAVFHDWRLDCQTNGTGVTHKQSFSNLKTLDLGHGFTSDGVSFPLRGKGVGLMPSLKDVLDAELAGQILINFKSKRAEEGKVLAKRWPQKPDTVFGVYGGAPPTRQAIAGIPDLRGYDRSTLLDCLKSYALVGWSSHVPKTCRNRILAVPINIAPWLWGWPHRFNARMRAVNTDIILLGPYHGGAFSSGIDEPDMLARVPEHFGGYIWTNRIEIIGPLVKAP